MTSVSAQKIKPPKPYGVLPNQNQLDWQENYMYAFVHFGLNTFTDKEWGYGDEDPKLFNPKHFDADQIVQTIKQGGFTGIILTCKHHDGFCLWPTKTTEHNISRSPFRNGQGDMVKEIEEACHKYGLRFGVYLSPWDRNNTSYGTQDYVNKVYREQLKELLTNYGPIFEIWHDGANGGDGYYGGAREERKIDRTVYYNWPNIWAMERNLQPHALIFGDIGPDLRWVGNESGIAGNPCWQPYTPESVEPGKDPSNGTIKYWLSTDGTRNGKYWMPAECDFSIRPGWFWHENENDEVRSIADLWSHYFLSVGRGAAMLLNVPPDKDGVIYKTDSINLKEFGEILKQTFSNNLAKGASIVTANVRGNDNKYYGTKNLLDDNQFSYWSTDDSVHTPQLTITLPEERSFDIIRLKENTKLGQRIDSISIDAYINKQWQNIAGANSIGSERLIRLDKKITTNKLRLNVVKSPVCVALSDFALFSQPDLSEYSTIHKKEKIISKANWKITNIENANDIIDNKYSTFWQSSNANFPQDVIVDLGETKTISSFRYLPRQDNQTGGIIDGYELYASSDGTTWNKISKGEFSNIQANPIQQTITFKTTVKARYFKFKILRTINNENPTIAELGFE
ncbi:MAG: alpha-L-fucosidase [Arachidicoccus sp.]|nr:alpha-L-fucosidase [Arachidicoccus sp.]